MSDEFLYLSRQRYSKPTQRGFCQYRLPLLCYSPLLQYERPLLRSPHFLNYGIRTVEKCIESDLSFGEAPEGFGLLS